MKARWAMGVVATWWALGGLAAAWAYGSNQLPQTPAVVRLGGPVTVAFTSAVADPYYVLSGPVESYEAVRFNQLFREALERYAQAKSGPGSETVVLSVHLEGLTTDYRQLGAGVVPAEPFRVAAAGVRVARGPLGRMAHSRRDGGGDLSVPAEITKAAALTFWVESRAADGAARREAMTASASVTLTWDDWDPWGHPGWNPWAYDYRPVLGALVRDAVARIDGFVEGAVRAPGR